MRSVSSSDVICSISMRWRSWGVRTRRCERLVVSLTDISQRLLLLDGREDLCGYPLDRIIPDQESISQSDLHAELFTEIEAPDFCVFCQVARGTRPEYFSLGHDISAIGHTQSLAHIVIRDEDSNPATAQIEDHALNVVNGLRIDTCKWLVQENELRFSSQGPGDFSSPPLAARQ